MTTPAGWYDDGSGRQRWWDGTAWTEHTLTGRQPAPQQPAAEQSAAQQAPEQQAEHSAAVSTAEESPAVPETSTVPETPAVAQAPAGQDADAAAASLAAEAPAFAPPFVLPSSGGASGYGQPASGSASASAYGQAPGIPQPGQGVYAPGQPPHGPYGTPPAPRKVSVLGIIGLAVATLGLIVSCIPPVAVVGWVLLGLGFVASLVSIFLRGAKWPGIVGMVVGVLGTVVAVAVLLIGLGFSDLRSDGAGTPDPVTTEQPSDDDASTDGSVPDSAETVTVAELQVGHCLPFMEWEEEVYELPVVPCEDPHTDEVYLVFDAPDGEFPGDAALQTIATERCDAAFAEFVGVSYAESTLDNYWFVPTEASWTRWKDRAIQCIVFSYDEVTGTLEGAAR